MTSQNSEATEALDLTRFHPCLLSVSYPAAPNSHLDAGNTRSDSQEALGGRPCVEPGSARPDAVILTVTRL